MDDNTVSDELYPAGYFTEPVVAWWSDWHSQTCDPASPHCVMSHSQRQRMLANKAGQQARSEGRIPAAVIPERTQRFYWRRAVVGVAGPAEQVWDWLRAGKGERMSITQASVLIGQRPGKCRQSLAHAVLAGVLHVESVAGEDCYRLGDVEPMEIAGRYANTSKGAANV